MNSPFRLVKGNTIFFVKYNRWLLSIELKVKVVLVKLNRLVNSRILKQISTS